jgi:AraC family transcriptional regulator
VLGGSFEETATGRVESCAAGTIVYHPSQEEHADHMGTAGARCFNLELSASFSERLEQDGRLPRNRTALGPGRATALGISLRVRRASRFMSLVVEEAVLELMAEFWGGAAPSHNETRRPPWLGRALERLRDSELPTVTELAADAGVHPVYFTRAFRTAMKMPPSRFVVETRLERASARLLSCNATSPPSRTR